MSNDESAKANQTLAAMSRLLPAGVGIRRENRDNTYILFVRAKGTILAIRGADEVAKWRNPARVFRSIANRRSKGIPDAKDKG